MSPTTREKRPFAAALARGGLVFDGAMGTALNERGVGYDQCFDHVTLTRPQLVQQVHAAHVQAGADVLTTNTFGANRFRLAAHALEREVVAINRVAVALAREVTTDETHVCASVGPTGMIWRSLGAAERRAAGAAFLVQCRTLVDAGASALILETFWQREELRCALRAALEASAGALPIVASVCFDSHGQMDDATGPERIADMLARWGAAAVAVNCADGPAGVEAAVTRMFGAGLPVVAQPSAGLPRRAGDGFIHDVSPRDFERCARDLYARGVRAVGGCCGSTPAHVAAIRAAAGASRSDAARVEPACWPSTSSAVS